MPPAVEPLAIEQFEHHEDFDDVDIAGAALMVGNAFCTRLAVENVADSVEMTLKVG